MLRYQGQLFPIHMKTGAKVSYIGVGCSSYTCVLTLIFSAAACVWRLMPSLCKAKNWLQHLKILEAALRLHGVSC